jgi:hypothetical protein
MIKNKEAIVEEMNELQNIIKLYQEAFPDLPVWSSISGGKKDKKAKKGQEEQKQVA